MARRPKPSVPVRILVSALLLAIVVGVPRATPKGTWPPPRCETGYPSYWDTTYWEARQVVTVLAHRDSSGAVTRLELFDDNSGGADIDCLLAPIWHWRFPHRTSPSQKGKPFTEVVHFVLNRSGANVRDRVARGLPGFAEVALEEPPFKRWVQAWAEHAPGFGFTDFVTCGYTDMHRAAWKGVLASPYMVQKRRFGLLLSSPDGRYVLDPFAGLEVSSDGNAAWDADTGYATFDAVTGDRLDYSVATNDRIDLARWINSTTFILLGLMRLDHPKSDSEHWVCAWVPAVWIGDMSTEKIAYYLGLPALPTEWPALERDLSRAKASVYPEVTW
jgi:hypothetical protein